MARNRLVTGPPRSGKSTVIRAVVERLSADGFVVGGVRSPERRVDGDRVGFDVVDVLNGTKRELAAVDRSTGPAVGKYRVAVENVDAVAATAFENALRSADVVVVDEIAPMALHSGEFTTGVSRALDSELPVVATVHYRLNEGFVGSVKGRSDVETHLVTPETRDDLPEELVSRVRDDESLSEDLER